MRTPLVLLSILLTGLASVQASAVQEEDGWVMLAQKTVAFRSETDTVNMLGKPQNLSKIKLTCIQGTGVFSKGMSSFAFTLPGTDTKLKELEIDYDSAGNIAMSKKAKVEVWGKKRKDQPD